MKIALTISLVLASATAFADGITVSGGDTDAVVTLKGIHAVSPHVRSVGDRIEIDVADESPAQIAIPNDTTVRKIEVTGGAHAHASLQITHSAKTTEILARATRVIEKGDDLILTIPRESRIALARLSQEASQTPTIPTPTAIPGPPPAPAPAAAPIAVPALVAATVAAPAPVPAPASVPAAAPAPPPIATPTPIPTTGTPASQPLPAAAAGIVAPTPPAPPLDLAESTKLPTGSLAVVLLFSAAGAGFFWLKRRKTAAPQPKHSIEILANRALGGKTRIVLIAVDDNELLLSVSDTGGARLLGSWPSGDDKPEDDWRAATATPPQRDDWRSATATPRLAEPLPSPAGVAPPRQIPAPAPAAARGTVDFGGRGQSPSVAGILRLKLNAAGSGPYQTADEADDDGNVGRDAAWVRELVNAARKGNRA